MTVRHRHLIVWIIIIFVWFQTNRLSVCLYRLSCLSVLYCTVCLPYCAPPPCAVTPCRAAAVHLLYLTVKLDQTSSAVGPVRVRTSGSDQGDPGGPGPGVGSGSGSARSGQVTSGPEHLTSCLSTGRLLFRLVPSDQTRTACPGAWVWTGRAGLGQGAGQEQAQAGTSPSGLTRPGPGRVGQVRVGSGTRTRVRPSADKAFVTNLLCCCRRNPTGNLY